MGLKTKDSPFNYELAVIPLDSSGVLQAGLPLEMKRRFKNVEREYRKICINKMFNAGDLYAFEDTDGFGKVHQMLWVGIGRGTLRDIERACQNIVEIPKIDTSITEIVTGGWKSLGDWRDIRFFLTRELRQAACRIVVLEDGIENETVGNLIFQNCWK